MVGEIDMRCYVDMMQVGAERRVVCTIMRKKRSRHGTGERMMDDVIYREDALERLRSIPADLGRRELDDSIKAIENMPSAQQWIPCSDRLPNYDEEVLVDYHGKVRLASLTKNDEEYPWYFIVNRFNAKLETVRAWMPLPDCYQGGEVI